MRVEITMGGKWLLVEITMGGEGLCVVITMGGERDGNSCRNNDGWGGGACAKITIGRKGCV